MRLSGDFVGFKKAAHSRLITNVRSLARMIPVLLWANGHYLAFVQLRQPLILQESLLPNQ